MTLVVQRLASAAADDADAAASPHAGDPGLGLTPLTLALALVTVLIAALRLVAVVQDWCLIQQSC